MSLNSDPVDRVMLDFSGQGISEVPLIGRYTYTHAYPPLRKHLHRDVFEVCLLQHGTQSYVIGNSRFDLVAGDMIITRPGEIHGTDTEPENRGRLYWIQFRVSSLDRSFLGLTPRAAHQLIEPLNHLTRHQFHNCELLLDTFERLFAPTSANMPKSLAKAHVQNLLLRLLLDILSLTIRGTQHAYSSGVRKALQHLGKHYQNPVSLSQLAVQSGTSVSYLKSHFKREAGMTPMEYLMWMRIEHSKRLLRETKIPITNLAFQCGFATSQHFATVFRRLTGLTPRDYRHRSEASLKNDEHPVVGVGSSFHPVNHVDVPQNHPLQGRHLRSRKLKNPT